MDVLETTETVTIAIPISTSGQKRRVAADLACGSTKPVGADGRSRGTIIGRDIITGVEEEFASAEKAANSCGITPAALRRTFVDYPTQFHGKHWRSVGMPFWIPPEGFVFDAETYEKGHAKAIRATSANESRVYESKTAACKILRCTNPRTLTDNVGTGRVFMGFVWTEVPVYDYGTWSKASKEIDESTSTNPIEGNGDGSSDGTGSTTVDATMPTSALILSATVTSETGVSGCCNGKIISRDLVTGAEIVFNSVTRAAAFHDISAHSLGDNFVDKPRHVRGKHFRAFTALRYWTPPSNFRYEATSFEKKTKGYIISTDVGGGERLMYESTKAAAELAGVKTWGVQQYIDSGKSYLGRMWTTAVPTDYDIWATSFDVHLQKPQAPSSGLREGFVQVFYPSH